jgi:hypothetical protein
MDYIPDYYRPKTFIGNWDWQPQKLKQQFGQLTISDLRFEIGKENDLLTRIGIRLNKKLPEVINILKKLKPF